MLESITELCRRISCPLVSEELLEIARALVVKVLVRAAVEPLVRVAQMLQDGGVALSSTARRAKRRIVRVYYHHYYYPGSIWMNIWCWLKHPVSEVKRAEAEFSAGWDWPDQDKIAVRVG